MKCRIECVWRVSIPALVCTGEARHARQRAPSKIKHCRPRPATSSSSSSFSLATAKSKESTRLTASLISFSLFIFEEGEEDYFNIV